MFDQVKNLFEKNGNMPEKIEAPFMVNRFLSMYSKTFFISVELNKRMSRLPNWAIVSFMWINVPHIRPAPYITYIKKKKKNDDKYIGAISNYLCCSIDHAEETLRVLKERKFDYKSFFGKMV